MPKIYRVAIKIRSIACVNLIMNLISRLLLVCILLALAGYIRLVWQQRHGTQAIPGLPVIGPVAAPTIAPGQAPEGRLIGLETALPDETIPPETIPPEAIHGERVIHFSSREQYVNYVQALADAGLAALGQIDSLRVLRVSDDVLRQLQPGSYGGQPHFAYRVERPSEPSLNVDPAQYGELRAFGQSARSIVGGLIEGDGAGVLVGILDSGIATHAQFDQINHVQLDLIGSAISDSAAAHGTAVASIITGSEGIAPAAELFVVRVLDEAGRGNSFHVAQGIVQAVDRGAKVLNLSLGLYQDTQLLREAVQYAHAHNVLMVAAAGNDGYARMPYPAAYPQVLSVTAVDGLGRQALFPNQSESIDFAAPGVGVLTAQPDEGSQWFSGTSAAAPFVSGTLAALLSADASRSSPEVVELIRHALDEAGAPGADPLYGDGLVNWERLRERNIAGLLDVALAEIYLPPDALPGTTMPVEVMVQNRGTAWLTTATLTVQVGASAPQQFIVGALGPGQTSTRTVYTQVPSINSSTSLNIAAQVLPEEPIDDVRLGNNQKAVFFRALRSSMDD